MGGGSVRATGVVALSALLATGAAAAAAKGTHADAPHGAASRAAHGAASRAARGAASRAARGAAEPADIGTALGIQLVVPTGWVDQPSLVAALGSPKTPVRVEARRGVGDPADGCFAVLERISAPAGRAAQGAVEAGFREALDKAGFATHDASGGFSLTGHGVEGRVRLLTASQAGQRASAVSAVCFYNHREPDRCRVSCNTLLESLAASP